MSKKVQRNSICPFCTSGKKYKFCCGKNLPIKANTLMYVSKEKENPTNFEKEVFDKIGAYPDDFIYPIKHLSKGLYILIDEAKMDNYYAVSGILIEKDNEDKMNNIFKALINLTEKYNIDTIHFNEIFGRKNILGDRKRQFIDEYSEILRNNHLKAFSTCMSLDEIIKYVKNDNITDEQCYMALTWRMMFDVLIYTTFTYGNEHIIEMWRESENITTDKRLLHQINAKGLLGTFPFARVSIYKEYQMFTKNHLLYSSLSDFIAYITIGIIPKLRNGKSQKILVRDNYDMLLLYSKIFDRNERLNYPELEDLVQLAHVRKGNADDYFKHINQNFT